MKPIITKFWLFLALLLSSSTTFAYDFGKDGIYYNKISSYACAVAKCNSMLDGEISIPSELIVEESTFEVVSVLKEAFLGCEKITAIKLPETIHSLGQNCFKGCKNLSNINIPPKITSLSAGCFSECSSLTTFSIPETITEIESECFYKCSGLTDIVIPISVKSIGHHGFAMCTNLFSVELPNSLEMMEYTCFGGCSALETINIPNSLQSISDGCFRNCISIKSISFPDSIKDLGEESFYGCTALSSIKLPKYLTNIGARCFAGCDLSSFEIPNSITELKEGCFSSCKNLMYIDIPENVINIGDKCFAGSGLTSIFIPETVNQVGEQCFVDCKQLKTVSVGSSNIGIYCFDRCELEYLYLDAIPLYDQYSYQRISVDTLVISPKIKQLNLGVYVIGKGQASNHYECLLAKSPNKIVFEDCDDNLQIGWITDSRGNDFKDTYGKNNAGTFNWGANSLGPDWGAVVKEVYLGRSLQGCEMSAKWIECLTLGEQLNKFELGTEVESIAQLQSLKYLNSLNPNPPTIGLPSNAQYENVNVVVPADFLSVYQNDPIWGRFWNSTAIENIVDDPTNTIIESIFDIMGKPVELYCKGIKIIRYKNGSIKKISL